MTVLAIRIFSVLHGTSMADLVMSDFSVEHIEWTDVKQRKKFIPMITGYTLIYDERPKREWKDWL